MGKVKVRTMMGHSQVAQVFTCPFCGVQKNVMDAIEAHIQEKHAEGVSTARTTSSPDDPKDEQTQCHSDAEYALQLALAEQGLDPALAFTLANAEAPSQSTSNAAEKEGTGEEQLSSESESEDFVECPCGERVALTDIEVHASLHSDEDMDISVAGVPVEFSFSTGPCNDIDALHNISNAISGTQRTKARHIRDLPNTPPKSKSRTSVFKDFILGPPPSRKSPPPKARQTKDLGQIKRLGKSELGPYAHEKRMPDWLEQLLERGAQVTITNRLGPNGTLVKVEAIANETAGLIPVLARLSKLDKSVERAYYCSEDVNHVAKLPREGGFCGYRNIQMLISYIHNAKALGHEHFRKRVPSILDLQDMIEHAWDLGFNSAGRVETGGIRLTRKYIGTPEAEALMKSLDISCEASAFSSRNGNEAYELLFEDVYEYFEEQDTIPKSGEVIITEKAPIYFQHQGHSMTIVGIEVRADGEVDLVVFDPMYSPSPAIKKLVDSTSFRCTDPAKLLKAHRRSLAYLRKYRDFELLKLSGPLPGSVREV